MENKNQKVWVTVLFSTMSFLTIILVGMGYAFFTTNNPEGSTAEIISKTGRMVINYNDGTDIIQPVTGIVPSNAILVDKTFTITALNTTKDMYMPLTLSLEYTNTFQNNELLYFIKITESSNTKMYNGKNNAYKINENTINYMGWSEDLLEYTYCPIKDWSGNLYTQKLYNFYLLPNQNEVSITFNFKMMFPDNNRDQSYNKGATFNGKFVVDTDNANIFAIDSWETIAKNVKNGNIGNYPAGAEKEVEIDGKSYTVRVANNTKPEECTRQDFSQTACGFVVEFADIVEYRNMNPAGEYKGTTYPDGWNVDGWPGSELYKYANGDFFNKLPSDLQSIIIDTKVVSGHGPDDQNPNREDGNWESTDKIYLLSTHEVWEEDASADIYDYNKISILDTAYNDTRQLDYYKLKGVTTNNYANAVKGNHNYDENLYNIDAWWLRAAYSTASSGFNMVDVGGQTNGTDSFQSIGFAPAFRIG